MMPAIAEGCPRCGRLLLVVVPQGMVRDAAGLPPGDHEDDTVHDLAVLRELNALAAQAEEGAVCVVDGRHRAAAVCRCGAVYDAMLTLARALRDVVGPVQTACRAGASCRRCPMAGPALGVRHPPEAGRVARDLGPRVAPPPLSALSRPSRGPGRRRGGVARRFTISSRLEIGRNPGRRRGRPGSQARQRWSSFYASTINGIPGSRGARLERVACAPVCSPAWPGWRHRRAGFPRRGEAMIGDEERRWAEGLDEPGDAHGVGPYPP
jgi:hypothetical protein